MMQGRVQCVTYSNTLCTVYDAGRDECSVSLTATHYAQCMMQGRVQCVTYSNALCTVYDAGRDECSVSLTATHYAQCMMQGRVQCVTYSNALCTVYDAGTSAECGKTSKSIINRQYSIARKCRNSLVQYRDDEDASVGVHCFDGLRGHLLYSCRIQNRSW